MAYIGKSANRLSVKYFTVMSPRTREQTPATTSPTTSVVAQTRFDARDPEVSIMIRPYGSYERARRDEQFSCLRVATSISRLYDPPYGSYGSWKRNISDRPPSPGLVLVPVTACGAIGNLTIFWLQIVASLLLLIA